MQLNQSIHQEISEMLSDETAPTVILGSLTSRGMSLEEAQQALDTVSRLRLRALEASRARQNAGHLPPPQIQETARPANPFLDALRAQEARTTTPEFIASGAIPHVNSGTHEICYPLGDRTGRLVISSELPRVVLIDDFLSQEECDQLLQLAPPVERSNAVDTQTGESRVHPARTSSGTFFVRGQNATVTVIEDRVARNMHWPLEFGEGMQILRYDVGQEYTPHFDYFDPLQPGSAKVIERSGNRLGTVIMYLEEPVRGGATYFPDAGGLRVYPRRGSALFFSYDRPHDSTRTRHAGEPVIEGVKWIATKWLRDRQF